MSELAGTWQGSEELACVHRAGHAIAQQEGWMVGLSDEGFRAIGPARSAQVDVSLQGSARPAGRGRLVSVQAPLGNGTVVITIDGACMDSGESVRAVLGLLAAR